jgi:Kef-type K+ transport system membrane component KefB
LLLIVGFVLLLIVIGLTLAEVEHSSRLRSALVRLQDSSAQIRVQTKLQAVGFGVFIPFFFIISGVRLDVGALFAGEAALALVPVFFLSLLLVRGLPATLYRPMVGNRGSLAAGLLQATSLTFIVAATGIGMELGLLSPATGAAMVVAGLLVVVRAAVSARRPDAS